MYRSDTVPVTPKQNTANRQKNRQQQLASTTDNRSVITQAQTGTQNCADKQQQQVQVPTNRRQAKICSCAGGVSDGKTVAD